MNIVIYPWTTISVNIIRLHFNFIALFAQYLSPDILMLV